MPTGYTACIADGVTFNEFVLRCARAMGPLVLMRDDPMDTPIPDEFKPDNCHTNAIARLEQELADYKAMTPKQCELAAHDEYWKKVAANKKMIEDKTNLKNRYEAMWQKVKSWKTPPSFLGLRDFMLEQIESSIKWDCDLSYYTTPVMPMSGEEFRAEHIATLEESLASQRKFENKEIALARQSTEWVRDLKAALKDLENK